MTRLDTEFVHPVKVTSVHPGGIKTNIMNNATSAHDVDAQGIAQVFDRWLARTSSQQAATIILTGVRKGHARVLVGPDAKLLDLIVRITGSGAYQELFSTVTAKLMGLATAEQRRRS